MLANSHPNLPDVRIVLEFLIEHGVPESREWAGFILPRSSEPTMDLADVVRPW